MRWGVEMLEEVTERYLDLSVGTEGSAGTPLVGEGRRLM